MFRKIHSDEEQLSREQLEADFSAAYTAHGGEILKYLLSSGMQTADAQDVLQNSFLAMWELRFRIEDTKNLAPLWFTIARHKMFDLFRSSRRRWFPFTGEEQNIPAPEGGMREQDQQYLRRRITAALAGLPEEMAEAYRLTKIGGLSIREAAEILKLSESDVKSKVFRARKKLMEELKDLRDFQKI